MAMQSRVLFRRCALTVATILLLLSSLLACVSAWHQYNQTAAPQPERFSVSGWIQMAGLPASSWPLAPAGEPDDNANNNDGSAPPWPPLPPAAGPFRYLINQEAKCPEEEDQPFLVLLIPTEAHQVEERSAIRETWGAERSRSPGAGDGPRVLRLFLLGTTEEEEQWRSLLEEENRRHGDILQQDFKDTYRNLTAKTLMGLNWVARHCPGAAYVMKADTDVFVNTQYLVHEVLGWRQGGDGPKTPPRKSLITGLVSNGSRPIRDARSKWYVSEEEYPGETYPDYCAGAAYLLSSDLAGRIYGASLGEGGVVPRFFSPFEDVHVGVALERLGVAVTPPPSPYLFPYEEYAPEEFFPAGDDRYARLVNAQRVVVAAHLVTPAQMRDYWCRLQNARRYY